MKVAFCIPGKSFSKDFLSDWTKLISNIEKYDVEWKLFTGYNPTVYHVRAGLLDRALEWQPDYTMWIDSDMVCFYVEHLWKLISHNKDIVSGLYLMKSNVNTMKQTGIFEFVCVKKDGTRLTTKDINSNGLMEVRGNGMGWMLIKTNVFKHISQPFMPIDFDTSEDISFQIKAKEKGFISYVDTSICIGHEKDTIIII